MLLHGLIRNADGSKMSRSKGTGVNPLEIIRVWFRYSAVHLITGNTPGNDISGARRRSKPRNFCNKIWNASRFVMMNLGDFEAPRGGQLPSDLELTLADRWILSRFGRATDQITQQLARYDLGEAARTIYDFIWGEYCDWYIEIAKRRLYDETDAPGRRAAQHVLWKVLDGALKLLHPFMPFITEGIWQHLPHEGDSIMVQAWPRVDEAWLDPEAEAEMAMIMETVRAIRNVRAEFEVAPSRKVDAIFHADGEVAAALDRSADVLAHLAGWRRSRWSRPRPPSPEPPPPWRRESRFTCL